VFVGGKMAVSAWLHVPTLVSLAIVVLTLAGAVGLSLAKSAREERAAA
jgi:predicted tellurium resistance membrane protein TerC